MPIDRPIFIVGNIRSGTTILYNLMSLHPEVCWFSNHTDRFPGHRGLILTHRLLDIPVIRNKQRQAIVANRRMFRRLNFVPWPDEGDRVYQDYCGFGQTKDGIETVLTENMSAKLRGTIVDHLRHTGKRRFLSKETANNRRLGLIDEMFPDAYYVHVIRDGRAVANSTLRVPWWNDTHIWWLGHTARQWQEQGREPVELCGLYWQRAVEEISKAGESLGSRYMEVRYENLTHDVKGALGTIFDFCQLGDASEYLNQLPEQLPDMNYKWRKQLTEEQKRALHDSIGTYLVELGYTLD